MSRISLGYEGIKYSLATKLIMGLWLLGGTAAFLISAGTSFYVIENISPNIYFAVFCAFAFDLVKVSSIFIERWNGKANDTFVRGVGKLLRISLMLIAFVFCAIAVSGLLLNKNQGYLVEDKKNEIIKNYESLIAAENQGYQENAKKIQDRLDEERNGDNPRIAKIQSQITALTKQHNKTISELQSSRRKEVAQVSADQYEGDTNKAEQVRNSIRSRYDRRISDENKSFNKDIATLNKELKSKDWYTQLMQEKKDLEKLHNENIERLNSEKTQKVDELEKTRFEGDERTQEKLITNFIKTVNRVADTQITYEQFIIFLVLITSGVVEITIYYTFTSIALAASEKIAMIKEHKKALLHHKIENARSELDYEKRAEDIITEGVIQEMIDTKNSKITIGKIDNYILKARDEMINVIKKAKTGFDKKFNDGLDKENAEKQVS